jgi:outer membrane protein assembly complex protein YaeT
LQYRVARVEISGNQTMSLAEIEPSVRVKAGDPFSEAKLDADVASIGDLYHRQGFSAVNVQSDVQPVPTEGSRTDAPVVVRLSIVENVRTVVGSVRIDGSASIPEAQLKRNLALQPGRPFSGALMALDRDAIELRYANLGFQNVTVAGAPQIGADGRADVVFTISEGPQLFVDRILIVGNVRTKDDVIEHELQFKTGDPLGAAAVSETQRRLAALGLFRRLDITAVGHGQGTRDVLITLDEAPVTTIGYGVGVEASERVVSTVESGGVAEQHLEFAPRAFFQISRSNLFGKNRSLSLSSLLSLRPKDSPYFANQPQNTDSGGQFGFAEYRILLTYREPHVFGTAADAFLNGTIEQQVRSSFDFSRRAFSAEFGRRVTRKISVSGNYQIQRIQLFNEAIAPTDQLLIDRLFPQVRLSSFSASVVRNTRDDPIDPSTGTYLSVYGQLAARAIGSEVGLAKSYLTAETFRTLPHSGRTVFAARASLGAAVGFAQRVTTIGDDGQPVTQVVRALPASERFFSGGDTTVRGFALDQLGTANTLDPVTGLAIGGNALVLLNAELRAPYRNFQLVGFFDTGNVFARPSEIDLGAMRSAVGIGLRYRSPVGPIRVDLGFKIHRHDIVPGTRESLTALHISLGQAF